MSSIARTRDSNVWTALGAILAVIHVVDFFFYGRHAYDLVAGLGFALTSIGAYLNGFQKFATVADSREKSVVGGYVLALAGIGSVIAGMLMKYAM